MNSQQAVIAGCLIEKDSKFLLVQEANPKAYKLWNIPAGYVDEGETQEIAAIRESKEESGYDVLIDRKIGVYTAPSGRDVHVFQAHILGGELSFPESETLAARWFTHDEIKTMHNEKQLRGEFVMLALDECLRSSL